MAERLPTLDAIEGEPVIGRRYLVPHVRIPDGMRHHFSRLRWFPVLGPKHEDREHLEFPHWHYHADLRFLPPSCLRPSRNLFYGGRPYSLEESAARFPLSERPDHGPLPAPVLRPAVCHRRSVALPNPPGLKISRLHAAYIGRPCGRSAAGRLVCPHKGFDLTGLPMREDGTILCPLHGLAIDPVAGVVVERKESPHVAP